MFLASLTSSFLSPLVITSWQTTSMGAFNVWRKSPAPIQAFSHTADPTNHLMEDKLVKTVDIRAKCAIHVMGWTDSEWIIFFPSQNLACNSGDGYLQFPTCQHWFCGDGFHKKWIGLIIVMITGKVRNQKAIGTSHWASVGISVFHWLNYQNLTNAVDKQVFLSQFFYMWIPGMKRRIICQSCKIWK